jgi:L-galactose dehydrogenase
MRYRTLGRCGSMVSELGFGASPLGGIYGTFAEHDGIDAVHSALDAGVNFLDVSPYYGLTAAETVLGKALRGIDRDRYVLATKVGRYGDKVSTSPPHGSHATCARARADSEFSTST